MIYRVGMIGMDGHTGYTLSPLPKMENARLFAVTCTDEKQIRELKASKAYHPEVKIYTDYHEMLEKESLDIACVYLPNYRHVEGVLAAVAAGAHVYSEKPLSITLEGLEQVKAAVSKAGVKLSMMLAMRGDGPYQKVHQLVRQGVVGEVAHCTAQKSYKVGKRDDWETHRATLGGMIPYIACHALDLIRWTTGLEFVRGGAFHNNVSGPGMGETENTANLILLANNGATISTRLDYLRPEIATTWGDDRLRVAGPEGVIEVQRETVTLITQSQALHTVDPAPPVSQFVNFIAAIEGREPLLVPTEDCYRITEVVLKLRDAADRQVIVDL